MKLPLSGTRAFRVFLTCILLATSVFLSGCGYNALQEQDEEITAAWSKVVNNYKRRADLIPNLVKTVQGYAEHEKEVFDSVTKARAQATQVVIKSESLEDAEAFRQFEEAQAGMQSALARLLAVAENYPHLKADASFRDLQAQLEGTENRITVARNRYIEAVRNYNTTVRRFPSNFTASWFGFERKPNFSVENEEKISSPPEISFDS